MVHSADYYADLSDKELAAADHAATIEDRVEHLEKAYRLARAAWAERTRYRNADPIRQASDGRQHH